MFPSSFHARKSIFGVAQWMGKEIHNLGIYGGHFFPCKTHKHFVKLNFSPRVDSPSTISFLVAKMFFFIPNTCVLLFYESLFWYELLGVEEAQNWLDKPSEERNLTKRSRGVG